MSQTIAMSINTLQGILPQVGYVQAIHDLLNIPDLTGLEALGLFDPTNLSGRYLHLALALYNKHGDPLGDLHGLAFNNETQTLEAMGRTGSSLRVQLLPPDSNLGDHPRSRGGMQEISDKALKRVSSQIIGYVQASHNQNLPYSVPAKRVKADLLQRLKTYVPESEEAIAAEPDMAIRRARMRRLLPLVPNGAFARFAREKSGWPVYAWGINSNTTAADLGRYFGLNLRKIFKSAQAPLIEAKAIPLIRAAKRPIIIPGTIISDDRLAA